MLPMMYFWLHVTFCNIAISRPSLFLISDSAGKPFVTQSNGRVYFQRALSFCIAPFNPLSRPSPFYFQNTSCYSKLSNIVFRPFVFLGHFYPVYKSFGHIFEHYSFSLRQGIWPRNWTYPYCSPCRKAPECKFEYLVLEASHLFPSPSFTVLSCTPWVNTTGTITLHTLNIVALLIFNYAVPQLPFSAFYQSHCPGSPTYPLLQLHHTGFSSLDI